MANALRSNIVAPRPLFPFDDQLDNLLPVWNFRTPVGLRRQIRIAASMFRVSLVIGAPLFAGPRSDIYLRGRECDYLNASPCGRAGPDGNAVLKSSSNLGSTCKSS